MSSHSLALRIEVAVDGDGRSGAKLIKSLANPLSNASIPKLLRRLITQSVLDLIELVVGHNGVLFQLVLAIRSTNISYYLPRNREG